LHHVKLWLSQFGHTDAEKLAVRKLTDLYRGPRMSAYGMVIKPSEAELSIA